MMKPTYCHGCMENIPSYPCPKCGYTPAYNSSPYALQPGTILQGKYLIGRVLGQGGFGITYIGMDLQLQRKVAIKEYYPSGFVGRKTGASQVVWYSSDAAQQAKISGLELVLKEARKISKLSGIETVVQVFNVFQENGTAYICMDFIEGYTLQQYLKNTGPLTWEQTQALFLPILKTMDQIHKLGLIHRDLSPDNLMLQPDGGIKILDLGAAKDLRINSGKSSMQVAKSGFSPLEQYIQTGNSGSWTDVYAIAATMYFTLTGSVPASAIDRMDNDTLQWDLPQLQALPPTVLNALKHAMAVRSSDRTQTMEAFTYELYNNVAGTKKKKTTSCTNPNKKKRKFAVIGAVAIAAIIIIATIGFSSGKKKTDTGKSPSASASQGKDTSAVSMAQLEKQIDELVDTCSREVYDYFNGSRMELYFDDQDNERLRIYVNDAGQDQFIFLAEYNADGNVLEKYGIEDNTLMRYILWNRNEDGKTTEQAEYEGNGTLIEKTEFRYDSQGRETARTRTDKDGTVLFEATSTYDAAGIRTCSGTYESGDQFVSHYNSAGRITDSITTDPDGKQKSYNTYSYDANGNQTEYFSYDENNQLSYYSEYHYDGDLKTGYTSTSYYESEEYIYKYEYIFGPRNIVFGEHCSGSYSDTTEYVRGIQDTWTLRFFTSDLEWSDAYYSLYTYNWDGDIVSNDELDESGNLLYHSETTYNDSGEKTGSDSIRYNSDGSYTITQQNEFYDILLSEEYDSSGNLLEKWDYQYDANNERTAIIHTTYNSDGSYVVSELDSEYHTLVTMTYDVSGTLLSKIEYYYNSSGEKDGSVQTTYYYDGSYTVVVKDANFKTTSEKTYDKDGNPI